MIVESLISEIDRAKSLKRQARLAALREVREMVDHRLQIVSNMTCLRSEELSEMRNRIDALIKREEEGR